MIITLTLEQQHRLLAWARRILEDHVNAECMPPGYTLQIEMGGPFGAEAWAVSGSARLELGDVAVKISPK